MREERGRGQQRPHHFHMFNLLEESFALLHKGLPPVTIPDEGGRREGPAETTSFSYVQPPFSQSSSPQKITPNKSEPLPRSETTKKLLRLHSDGDDDEVFVELRRRKRKER